MQALSMDHRAVNLETREKRLEVSKRALLDPTFRYFELAAVRQIKERLLKDQSAISTKDEKKEDEQSVSHANLLEFPDGTKVPFEDELNYVNFFFDPRETNLMSCELQTVIAESMDFSDLDVRKNIGSSIVVSGGNTLIPKFVEKLEESLIGMSKGWLKTKVVAAQKGVDRKLAAWTGGSITASTGAFQNLWVSRFEFAEVGESIIHRKCVN